MQARLAGIGFLSLRTSDPVDHMKMEDEIRTVPLDNPSQCADICLPMSLSEWLWPNPRSRALDGIASIAADYRILAANLERHAAACRYPTIRAGLEKLSAAKLEQAEDLCRFLSSDGRAASSPNGRRMDGSSNWLRLKADLALESRLLRELNQAIVRLEGSEHRAAQWLRDFAAIEERRLGELRDLVLKCDTYALD
jgi:hypothetical protein